MWFLPALFSHRPAHVGMAEHGGQRYSNSPVPGATAAGGTSARVAAGRTHHSSWSRRRNGEVVRLPYYKADDMRLCSRAGTVFVGAYVGITRSVCAGQDWRQHLGKAPLTVPPVLSYSSSSSSIGLPTQ
eukprot:TRINITY_DN13739_c0_g1_i1.p1 TRINITY_DN13739_c0_g1~~TRINITY_DN13739_c0_g1_i1.p1  ORF type:complete len:129 (+),score=15.97 TRINITY_DN13739_c0_g1_i1:300-686(+)